MCVCVCVCVRGLRVWVEKLSVPVCVCVCVCVVCMFWAEKLPVFACFRICSVCMFGLRNYRFSRMCVCGWCACVVCENIGLGVRNDRVCVEKLSVPVCVCVCVCVVCMFWAEKLPVFACFRICSVCMFGLRNYRFSRMCVCGWCACVV